MRAGTESGDEQDLVGFRTTTGRFSRLHLHLIALHDDRDQFKSDEHCFVRFQPGSDPQPTFRTNQHRRDRTIKISRSRI
jgi:hypothetical protein